MSVWILHLKLTPREEVTLTQQGYLPLPLGNLPDLSMVDNQEQCKHLLQALYPDDPPESIQRKLEKIWKIFSGVQEEDIIAVPLQHCREVMIAEVIGRYHYQAGKDGSDTHTVPVKWHERRIAFTSFKKQQDILVPGTEPMFEVEAAEARVIIRDRLPYGYNRFVRWKWLFVIFLIMQAFMLVMRMAKRL